METGDEGRGVDKRLYLIFNLTVRGIFGNAPVTSLLGGSCSFYERHRVVVTGFGIAPAFPFHTGRAVSLSAY